MTEGGSGPRYDLEARTEAFAKSVRRYVKTLPRCITNTEDVRQLARASGSVAANYIEANEALGQKDFLIRLRTRKGAKESRLFLRLLDTGGDQRLDTERASLCQEATELMLILSSILRNSGSA